MNNNIAINELEQMTAQSRILKLAGSDWAIEQIKVKHMGKVLRLISEGFALREKAQKAGTSEESLNSISSWVTFLEPLLGDVSNLVSAMCRVDLTKVEELSIEDYITIITALVEVNKSFLVVKLAAQVQKMAALPATAAPQ